MPYLDDGTVIPYHFDVPAIKNSYDGEMQSNMQLRLGEVQDIIYPEDPRSFSKTVIEYSVYVQHKANGTAVTRIYEHCVLINPLASLADKAFWTLRKSNSATQQGANGLGLGSKVLILCLQGETNNAVIIGGLRDQKDINDKNAQSLGHHLEFLFNGIEFFINNDGELIVTYGGATANDGSTSVPNSSRNTTLSFLKDGSLDISTDDGSGNKDQSININHTTKEININTTSNVTIKSSGVLTGTATDNTMKGTTYRNAQATLDTQLVSGLTQLSAEISAAGAALTMAGNIPVYTLAAPHIITAGAALTSAISGIVTMLTAINTFESGSAGYLSLVNKSD